MNKGSEWRKWNFHVHTKGTSKNDQFKSETLDSFFYTFFKKAYDSSVEAIAITDYFSIDRYQDAIEYVDDIENKTDENQIKLFTEEEIDFIKKIFIFPNIELRMLPATDRARLINIHCLFNPDYVNNLENDFFGHLTNQDGKKMNRHGLIDYGRSLDNSLQNDDERYRKGLDNFVIDLKSMKELINNNQKFNENCIIVVSNSNNDGASGLQKHYDLFENDNGALNGLRKSIYQISNCIFSTNEKDIKYFLGKRLEGTENESDENNKKEIANVIKNTGSLKPCIVGCDSHKEETLFNKFTWVKSDLTFEGLRQICIEPEQRVKIQDSKPDFKEDKVVIEKVRFSSTNKIFNNNNIYLSPNLNVIIGGKSSGKSILLYSIAKTLLPEHNILKNDNNEYKYKFTKIDPEFDFEVTTKSGITQKMNRAENLNSIIPEIKYIPQNYLVKLAEPEINKKGKPLNKLVRDLINEDDESKNKYGNFISSVKNFDYEREETINQYFLLSDEIKSLKTELKTKSNREVLEKNIESNSKKVDDLNKKAGLSEEELDNYKIILSKKEKNTSERNKLLNEFRKCNSSIKLLVQKSSELKTTKLELIESLESKEIYDFYKKQLIKIDELVKHLESLQEEIKIKENEEGHQIFVNQNKFGDKLKCISDEKSEIIKELEPYQKNEAIQEEIKKLNESITIDKKLLTEIKSINEQIINKTKALTECKNKIFSIFDKSYEEYQKIIDSLSERTNELEKDGLKIEGIAQFNFRKIREIFYEISDGRKGHYRNYPYIFNDSKKSTDEFDYAILKNDFKKLFDEIINDEFAILPKTSKKSAIKKLLDDYFFDYWKITYKNDKLSIMSTGKASFVILMLIIGLSKSKSPILIDQPEDNLDNRSITKDLVFYLKNKKLERQIIVVTHNANIVVNADAENIIIANQKGQTNKESSSEFQFDYINGAIENTFPLNKEEKNILKSMGIREHVAEIVEGGKEAFIAREKKYRFKNNIA